MSKRKYDILLFDMDGTLCDSDPMLYATFCDLYDMFKGGQRKTKEEIVYFSGPPIRDTLRNEFPDVDPQYIFDLFSKISRSYYDTHIFAYDKEKEVLLRLKEAGFKLGVVTNKTHELTLVALKVIGLEDVFDVIIGFNDVTNPKPSEEGILKAIQLFSGKKEKSIYIGDNKIDYLSAVNAGIDSCLVNWGPRVPDSSLSPTMRIDSYLDLEEKLYE